MNKFRINSELVDYLLQEKDVEKQLDIVELSFKTVNDSKAIEELSRQL
jgi:hypothetical protein